MTTHVQKRVLYVQDETTNNTCANTLRQLDLLVETKLYKEITPELVKAGHFNLIFVDYTTNTAGAAALLEALAEQNRAPRIPIVVVVSEEHINIEDPLWHGAIDYVTVNETEESIAQKIQAIFNDTDTFAGSPTIDITPTKTQLKTSGIRVYLVEDDPLLRNLLSIRLEKSKFPYRFDINGEHIVESLRQFKPDVIILDLMLPGRSGFEVLADIKGADDLRSLPVIVFSNRDGHEDRLRAAQLGADTFFVKVMTDLSELIEKIESLVQKK